LLFYGNQSQLEYDFFVAPGADPSVIALRFDDATSRSVAPNGDLVLTARNREIRQIRPLAYQVVNGQRRPVDSGYVVNADGDVTFALGDYDRSRELIIDPVLVFSSYMVGGGDANAQIKDVAVDLSGNMYVTGWGDLQNFPTLGFGTRFGRDAFVIKLDSSGSRIRYALYLGGDPTATGGDDEGRAIAVDYNGNAFLAGITQSSGFPTTTGAYSRMFHGGTEGPSDIWVAKIDSGGQRLVYSTYLGGSDDEGRFAVDIAIDASGNAYVAGETLSSDFPTTAGALDTTPKNGHTAFVTKFKASGSALVYSTLLTGVGMEAHGIAVDAANQAYVTGFAALTIQTTPGAFQTTKPTTGTLTWDVYVMKLNASGSAFVYSTYLGGAAGFDVGESIAVDASGAAYVAGRTDSTDFPTMSAAQASKHGPATGQDGEDAFVTKLNPTGSRLQFSTYLGGSAMDRAYGISVTPAGFPVVAGMTRSTDFPVKNAIQSTSKGSVNAWIAKFDPSGTNTVYSTYLGGSLSQEAFAIAAGEMGDAYLGGHTASNDFPLASPHFPYQPCAGTNICDEGFLARVSDGTPGTTDAGDAVLYAARSDEIHGRWVRSDDATAAGGRALRHPDGSAAKIATPLATPANYFELTADIAANKLYRLWIRGKADANSWANDSMYVQFTSSFTDANMTTPVYQIGTTSAMTVQIEDCTGCGLHGWGWNDNGYGYKVLGAYVFLAASTVTIRVQTREDGVAIDQIVLSPVPNRYGYGAPGFQKEDATILPQTAAGGSAADNIVLYAAADHTAVAGRYSIVSDTSAAGGARMFNPDDNTAKLTAALANPTIYFEVAFNAVADTPYRIWVRGKAQNDFWGNDSVFVQFDGTIDSTGTPLYRIGTTSSTTVNLEDCSGCGLHIWAWQDNGWGTGVLGPVLRFATSGPQKLRIQPREDGLSIDQIVLSPEGASFFTTSPGALKDDTTIVPQ
jgi:hypothetical protein